MDTIYERNIFFSRLISDPDALTHYKDRESLFSPQVQNTVWLIRYINDFTPFKRSLNTWFEANRKLNDLQNLGVAFHNKLLNGFATPQTKANYLQRGNEIKTSVNHLTQTLEQQIYQSTSWLERVIEILVILFGGFLLTGGIAFILRNNQKINNWQRLLEWNNQHYKSLFSHNPQLALAVNQSGVITEANEAASTLLHKPVEKLRDIRIQQLPYLQNYEKLEHNFRCALDGEKCIFEMQLSTPSGDKKTIHASVLPIYINDDVVGIYLVGEDITQQKKFEDELKYSQALYSQLFRNAPLGIIYLNTEGEVEQINKKFTEIFGYILKDLEESQFPGFLIPSDLQKKEVVYFKKALSGKVTITETIRQAKSGEIINVLVGALPVTIDHEVVGVFGLYLDITEQKVTEKKLQESLKNAEVLLQEVHHRVKNNLAVIAGLVELQIYSTEEPVLEKTLKNTQSRIFSIATIHELLYQSQNFVHVPIKDYLDNVVSNIQTTYNSGKDIEINIKGDDVGLNVNQAVPCALLLNELITNAYKHAFTSRQNGRIDIEITKTSGNVRLVIKDNGRGFPADFDMQGSDSMGMSLIQTLTRQLEAEISFDSNQGAQITLEFEMKEVRGSASTLE